MPLSFGILSTYPPTQCGLATFSASLADALEAAGSTVGVVSAVDVAERTPNRRVAHQLIRNRRNASAPAACVLNDFDVVIVQHEFGIYGGDDGDDLIDVLDEISSRLVVVAHTVLSEPSIHQREVLEEIIYRADVVVTMTMTARRRLIDAYGIDGRKVVVIPHGAIGALPKPAAARRPGPPRLLTWGLIGPGKGIESVVDALSRLSAMDPQPRYDVVGQTHPRVLAREGEAYRDAVLARAIDLGVDHLVTFRPAYLDTASLQRVISDADVVVLPYESHEQVTSGVLIEAVAAGKPVVATAFPHAVELLGSGAGITVPHNDPAALADAIGRVLCEPGLAASMIRRAAAVALEARWPQVALRYQELGAQLADSALVA
jgi:polysaccharide biosynthesis protein PslF